MKRDEGPRAKKYAICMGGGLLLQLTPLAALAEPDLLAPVALGAAFPGAVAATLANIAFHRMMGEPDVKD